MGSVTLIGVSLLLYLALIVTFAVEWGWESDIIGGFLTLPIEVVFIAALVDRYRTQREDRAWTRTRELLVDNSRALLDHVLGEFDKLGLVFNPATTDAIDDPAARTAYLAKFAPSLTAKNAAWKATYGEWLQAMQLSSGCFSPAIARHIVAFNHSLKPFTNLYSYYEAIVANKEKQLALGELRTEGADLAWALFEGFEAVLRVEGLDRYDREVRAAVDGWAVATEALSRMYEELGFNRVVEKPTSGPTKIVLTRGKETHFFLVVGDGLRSTLTGIASSLRSLR